MKQNSRPDYQFDYEALEPLSSTLEELFITGTPTFSPVLKGFTKLHTLSLGIAYFSKISYIAGNHCHNKVKYWSDIVTLQILCIYL